MELTSLHKEKYGDWAGKPKGNPPRPARCVVEVYPKTGFPVVPHQCGNNRGFGPEGAYCKQHDPAAVAAREAQSEARYNAKTNEERKKWWGPRFLAALEAIEAGHNDPRTLATELLTEFRKGQR